MQRVLCAVAVLMLSACSTVPSGFTQVEEIPPAILAACPPAEDKGTYKSREELETLIAMERQRYNQCRRVTFDAIEGKPTAPGFNALPMPWFKE